LAIREETGYKENKTPKESNAALRDIMGKPLAASEIKQLSKIFNIPVADDHNPELKAIAPVNQQKTNTETISGQNHYSFSDKTSLRSTQPGDFTGNEKTAFVREMQTTLRTQEPQENHPHSTIETNIHSPALKQEESNSKDESVPEVHNHDIHAFKARATGAGAAGRAHVYQDQKDGGSTLAGNDKDNEDDSEENVRNRRLREFIAQQDMINNLNSQIAAIDLRLEDIRNERLQLQSWVKDYKQLQTLDVDIKEIRNDLASEETKLLQAEQKQQDMQTEQEQVAAKIVEMNTIIEGEQDGLAKMMAERASSEETFKEAKQQFENKFGIKYQDNKFLGKDANGTFVELDADKQLQLQKQFAPILALRERHLEIIAKEDATLDKISHLDEHSKALKARYVELNEKLTENAATIETIRTKIADLKSALEEKQEQYQALNQKLNDDPALQKFIADNNLDPDDLAAISAAAQQKDFKLSNEQESLLKERAELSEQVNELKQSSLQERQALDSALNSQSSLGKTRQALGVEALEVAQESKELHEDLSQIQTEKDSLRDDWHKAQKELKLATEQLEQIEEQSELIAKKEDFTALVAENVTEDALYINGKLVYQDEETDQYYWKDENGVRQDFGFLEDKGVGILHGAKSILGLADKTGNEIEEAQKIAAETAKQNAEIQKQKQAAEQNMQTASKNLERVQEKMDAQQKQEEAQQAPSSPDQDNQWNTSRVALSAASSDIGDPEKSSAANFNDAAQNITSLPDNTMPAPLPTQQTIKPPAEQFGLGG